MFWPVVLIAACAASRPLSAVCRPMKVGIMARSYLQVEHAVSGYLRGGAPEPVAGGVVALVSAQTRQLEQVVEEGELLAHQRPIDVMLALDELEQATQLGAAGAGRLSRLGVHQSLKQSNRHRPGGDAEPGAGPLQQPQSLGL